MAPRSYFAFASLVLIAGAILLIFLTLLAGAVDSDPLNKVYFLQADTSAIPNAPPVSRWTFWNLCSVSDNGRNACPSVHPAFPLDPPSGRNFGTDQNVPSPFLNTRTYFYLTRFMFAWVLIALFFAVFSLFFGAFALCSRIGSYLSSVLCFVALFFQTLTATFMTGAYVKGKDNFQKNNQTASLGKYAFGFIWAAMACLLIATILFCMGGSAGRRESTYTSRTGGRSFFNMFGRKKSTRTRGSFINDAGSTREIKRESSFVRGA